MDAYYWEQQTEYKKYVLDSSAAVFVNLISVIIIASTVPAVTEREVDVFFYPIYAPEWLRNLYCQGGWFWIYLFTHWMY